MNLKHFRSEGMSSRGISSLSAKRRGADWVQVFQCRVVSCRVVSSSSSHPFLHKKGSVLMILGSSGSPRKQNFVPDLFKSLPEAILATKNQFFSKKKLKTKKTKKSKKSKIFKIGPRINNSARNLFRMTPHA